MMSDDSIEQNEQEEQEQEGQENKTGPAVSILDPDFLLFALPFAIFIDFLDFAFEVGTIVSLFLGGILIWWFTSRTGRSVDKQQLGQDLQQRQQQRQMAKRAATKALRRGILMFVAELIPILNLFPFWVIFVCSALKERLPETSSTTTGA